MRIVTLTLNPAIDTSTSVERVVADRKLRCAAPRHDPGGGGINVSRAIQRLGGESRALFTVGGPTGQMLQGILATEGIQGVPIPAEGWTREHLIVLETSTGRQYRFGMPGPELQEAEWQACLEAVETLDPRPQYLVASGSLPPGAPADFYGRVARLAAARGIRVAVDTSGAALRLAAEAGPYLLKPNLRELERLTGRELAAEDEQEQAAMMLVRDRGVQVVVVSLGAGGALLATRTGVLRMRAPTVRINSRVGAGDSMVAGIVLSLARGWPVDNAVRFGVAAGAAAVKTPGTDLCRREDAERLYEVMRAEAAGAPAAAHSHDRANGG